MKNIFKLVLIVVFSFYSFCAPAQTNSADTTQESTLDLLEHFIDSLGKAQGSKSVASQIQPAKISDIREIDIAQPFQDAEIVGDVAITLTDGSKNKLLLKGDPFDIEHTKVTIKNGKLSINAGSKTKSKLHVYLSASGISSLTVEGDSEIFSSGTIIANGLQIILNGTSMVSVRYYKGRLDVFAGGRSELIDIADYKKIVSRK